MPSVIQAEQLTRRFDERLAVDGLTFQVEQGEVFGMLGPNGAGKTTTVRLLNGLIEPTSGRARILGLDPATQGLDVRRHTGVLTETPSLYERLTPRENLALFGALYEVPEAELPARVDELLGLFRLAERAEDKVGALSKGTKQRLALARALIHKPELLFLDEPTSGLDPEAARHVTDLIERLSHQDGRTVFLCTHNLDEAQRLCDRVAVVNRGRLLALGTQDELAGALWHGLWVDVELSTPPPAALRDGLRTLPGVIDVQPDTNHLAVKVEGADCVPALVASLVQRGAQVLRVNPREHSLEEIYFALQNQEEGRLP
jgi:ABC-2 type transport system ATP-binding protein